MGESDSESEVTKPAGIYSIACWDSKGKGKGKGQLTGAYSDIRAAIREGPVCS